MAPTATVAPSSAEATSTPRQDPSSTEWLASLQATFRQVATMLQGGALPAEVLAAWREDRIKTLLNRGEFRALLEGTERYLKHPHPETAAAEAPSPRLVRRRPTTAN